MTVKPGARGLWVQGQPLRSWAQGQCAKPTSGAEKDLKHNKVKETTAVSEKKSLHRFFSIPLNKVNSAKSDSDFAAQQTVLKIIWHQRYNKHRFTPPNGTSHFCKAEIEPLPYRCGGRVLQLVNSVRPYTICADIASL